MEKDFLMPKYRKINHSKVLHVGDKIVIVKFQCEEEIISIPRPCLSDHMSPATWMLGKTLFSSSAGLNMDVKLAPGVYLPSHIVQKA